MPFISIVATIQKRRYETFPIPLEIENQHRLSFLQVEVYTFQHFSSQILQPTSTPQ